MTKVLNRAAGARVFHVKSGKDRTTQVTLAPGQSADLDLADMDDPVLKAWMDSGEVMVGSDADRHMRRAAKGSESREERIAALRAELAELEAMEGEPADPAAEAPPAQLGGDGGPEQMPTVGGRDGKPTEAQEAAAKEGKQSPPVQREQQRSEAPAEQPAGKGSARSNKG